MTKIMAAVLMAIGLAAQTARSDVWQDLGKYTYGSATNSAEEAEKVLQATPVAQHGAIEDALIAGVSSKDSTADGKSFACRLLQRIGTEKCIPAVAGLLGDETLSHNARLVLERIGSPKADEAMRAALDSAPDKAKAGIMASLGEHRDAAAVKAITKYAGHADPEVASAALKALGKIGGKEAADFLVGMKPGDAVKSAYLEALVNAAKSLEGSAALSLNEKALAGDKASYRIAAIRGMLDADEKKAIDLMTGVIKGDDVVMRNGVLTLVAVGKGEAVTKAMSGLVGGLPDEKKVELITALGARGDKAAFDAVAGSLASTNTAVCEAAIQAAGKMGDAASVKALLGLSHPKAAEALARMTGADVDGAIVAALGDNKLKEPAIKALQARRSAGAVSRIIPLTSDKDAGVRKTAWAALGSLATPDDIGPLAKAAFAIKDPEEGAVGVAAVRNLVATAPDKAKCFDVIAALFDGASDTAQLSLVDLANAIGGPTALAVEKKAVRSSNKDVYGKAVRALAEWKDAAAAGDLLALAKSGREESDRIVSLRGYIRIATARDMKLSDAERMAMLKEAAAAAKNTDLKKQIIEASKHFKGADVLVLLTQLWEDKDVRNEVEQAAQGPMWDLRKQHPAEAKALATKLQGSGNGGVAEKAKQTLADIK